MITLHNKRRWHFIYNFHVCNWNRNTMGTGW